MTPLTLLRSMTTKKEAIQTFIKMIKTSKTPTMSKLAQMIPKRQAIIVSIFGILVSTEINSDASFALSRKNYLLLIKWFNTGSGDVPVNHNFSLYRN